MDRTRKKPTKVECYFDGISEPETRVYRGKDPRRRAVLQASTDDGQKMFFEVREKMIDMISSMGIEVDDAITVEFVFEGKEFNGRWYNNLFINNIEFTQ